MNMGFQRDSVPLVGLGEAHYQSSRSDTFFYKLSFECTFKALSLSKKLSSKT